MKLHKHSRNKQFSIASFFALASLVLVILFYENTALLTLLLFLLSIVGLYIHHTRKFFKVFIFSLFFGAIAEIVAIHFGAWSYAVPDFAGIPYWLPFLWGFAGLYLSFIYAWVK